MMQRISWLSVLLAIFVLLDMGSYSSAAAAAAKVRLGVENIEHYMYLFQGKRVGLITNHTGIDSNFRSTVDILNEKTNLVALFAPEHGIRGNVPAGAAVGFYTDERTGVTVYSLYGATKKPTPEMLANVDVLVFDIQDVGARFYTYIYTMAYAMQACSELGKTFVVLDRPNPVGGVQVEGKVLEPEFQSFIGLYPIPIRHGMTVGELAQLFNSEFGINCDLHVVKMTGWRRDMLYDETGLPWVMTSPNMPTVDTALVYSGIGIFGGTNISEGVGTTRPFELVGAPWLDAQELADRMNAQHLPGVIFRPAYFTPAFSKYKGQVCGGVQIHVVDRKAYKAVRTGLALLYTIIELSGDKFSFNAPYREGSKPNIDLATGDDSLRLGRYTLDEIIAAWDAEAEQFRQLAKPYLLYE
ncbi:exo-beta-N-acetylmuramidase NamZ family protein [Thermosinus carboxydivorans]|nr:DUF1343 domain-containing protein [Thermosinus carboxydivorans]